MKESAVAYKRNNIINSLHAIREKPQAHRVLIYPYITLQGTDYDTYLAYRRPRVLPSLDTTYIYNIERAYLMYIRGKPI